MKRYCQTLELPNDPAKIIAYTDAHAHVWPVIQEGIKEVGILDMQIFIKGNRLFMIVDTIDGFEQLVKLMVEHDIAKVAAEGAAAKVRTNLAEYLEKGIVK